MNKEQEAFLKLAYEGHNIFLTGAGGTGKSYIIHHLVEEYIKRGVKYGLTAMTGCAALLLGNARTLHSWACVGLGKDSIDKLVVSITNSKKSRQRWISAEVLIIDEVSMMDVDFFEKLDAIGRIIRKKDKPFGGLQVIFVGDFFQLPPVDNRINKFIFETSLWSKIGFKIVELKEVIRQKDPIFHKILNEARFGELSKESVELLKQRMGLPWKKLEIKPTLLFPQNSIVKDVNTQNLAKLPEPHKTYKVETSCQLKRGEDLERAIEKAIRNASYDEELILKVGAQVMLLINKDIEHNLINGSRGIVTGFTVNSIPLVKFNNSNEPIPIDYYTWKIEDTEGMTQKQIPLKLAYALTVHKAQGATLDSALIDISQNIFECGQAYVALSRVKSLESLYVWDINPNAFKAHPKVKKFYEGLRSLS